MFAIKPSEGDIRTSLCIENIHIHNRYVLEELGLMTVLKYGDEDVYFFKEAVNVPLFNAFYASPIKNLNDSYLLELTKRLIYLNPGKDELNKKKLTEFIIGKFVLNVRTESELGIGNFTTKPVIRFEELYEFVKMCVNADVAKGYVPDSEKYVLYSENSTLTKSQKISISSQFRAGIASNYFEKAIHNAAEYLIEAEDYLKITESRIKETNMVLTSYDTQASMRTIKKYMSPRTKRMIEEVNTSKPFKSEKTQLKYLEFLRKPYLSLEAASAELGVSKSTVVYFKDLSNEGEGHKHD